MQISPASSSENFSCSAEGKSNGCPGLCLYLLTILFAFSLPLCPLSLTVVLYSKGEMGEGRGEKRTNSDLPA